MPHGTCIGVLLYCGAPISGAGTRGGRGPWWHGQTNTPHPSEANGTGENYTIYHLSTKCQDKTEPKIAIATQIMPKKTSIQSIKRTRCPGHVPECGVLAAMCANSHVPECGVPASHVSESTASTSDAKYTNPKPNPNTTKIHNPFDDGHEGPP